ncbi:tetratricopeptide repeat protein [bacterium]|nr:tetratricopeptide repeat protein [bacterium]
MDIRKIFMIYLFISLSSNLLGLVDSLQVVLKNTPSEEKARIHNQISRELMKNDRESALLNAELAFESAKKHNNNFEIADAIRLKGNYYYNGKNYSQSLQSYQEALQYALETQNIKLIGDIYNNIGQSFLQLGELGQGEDYLLQALQYRNRLSFHDDEISTMISLGQIYWLKQDYQQALLQYQTAANLLQKTDNPKLTAANYNNMGNTYVKLGKILPALEVFIKSLEIKTEIGSDSELAVASLNIGNLFYRINQYERAKHYYLNARELFVKTSDPASITIVDGNLGVLYNALGEYSKSLEFHQSVLNYYRKQGLKQEVSKTLNNIGNVYQNMADYTKAVSYYNESKIIKQELKDLEGLGITEKNIGEVHFLIQDWETALKHTEYSLEIGKELNKKLLMLHSYLQLSKIQAEMGDFQQAYGALMKYFELDQELHEDKSLKAIAEMMDRLDNKERIEEIKNLRTTSEQREAEMKKLIKQRLLFILIVFVGSFFTIAMIVLYRQKKRESDKSKKLSAELEDLNSKLEERIAEEMDKFKQQQLLVNRKSKLESLGVLAAGIAHEINQPLSAISMSLDNIKNKTELNKLDSSYLGRKNDSMQTDVDRIRKIIEHVRVFSRFQTDDDLEQIDIYGVINEAISIFEPVLKKCNISLKTTFSSGKPIVLGNRVKLEQVIINLLSNAKDTTLDRIQKIGDVESPSIEVVVKIINKQVSIAVIDYGMGISDETIGKIFDPFFTTKNPDKGTGLGLAISYSIVVDMEGTLSVTSTPNEGSTFEITIPLIRS